MRPGEIRVGSGPPPAASPDRRVTATVRNTGRLPAYVGSHFELARVSRTLELDREALAGARADIPAGATVRIPPGETIELDVVWD